MSHNFKTVVLDAGARYGMHPSWDNFLGEMEYLAFEPDADEAERLRGLNDPSVFKVIESALYNKTGTFEFNLLKHRGMSSFLMPDMQSECFKDLKPGLGEVERTIPIETRSIDSFVEENNWFLDFLKVDTEGTEHEVIVSAEDEINRGVLGIRSSMNFNPCFHNQVVFSKTHDFLLKRGFILLNLDYEGLGYPKLGLFKKPDPNLRENARYGVLVGCDAVWIRKTSNLKKLKRYDTDEKQSAAAIKLAYFCMLNNAPDVGVDIILKHALENKKWNEGTIVSSSLYKGLQFTILRYLGGWRTVPDETWANVQNIYHDIYGEDIGGGSGFYPQLQSMAKELGVSNKGL